ncbi:Ap2-like ethylene-responsive transcription factor ail5 [Thalictrum thalictroides]|uniref:Ap2-like ethylene-responsive transcription factor ail5 n=1 Tax=Thalictrum thalictroides TaxID=46969 RepID=A0A7J6VCQ1_THATH|nr:Ap2-like ethylene-responsive transcription factor ail5 [Thalictrum thalictroides]
MDSSSSSSPVSSQNWLAFSLSHPHHYPPTSDDDPVSLYHQHHQTFNTTTTNTHHHSIDSIQPNSTLRNDISNTSSCPLDLSMFSTVGPKLEDFLGGGLSSNTSLCQFSGENNHQSDHNNSNNGNCNVVYDSELKSIAASFLRGYSSSMSAAGTNNNTIDSNKKAVDTFGQRTSIYRGVTRHRWTGRYEAHLWDNSCRREGQSRKGRQVYLGGYDKEEKAARAYDLAALKYWGPTTTTNFPVCNYEKELEDMKNMTRQEFVASLRRKSSGFSRGASIYRGVTRHHQHGRWQARIGRVAGNKDLYLGTFSTQEEAAEAYDIAAIKFRGLNAVTNFDMSRYDVKSIASSSLPIGGITNKPKASSESLSDNKSRDGTRSIEDHRDVTSLSFGSPPSSSTTTTLSFGIPVKQDATDYWSLLGYQNPMSQNNPNKNNSTTSFQSCLTNGSAGSTFHSNQNMDYSTNSDHINQTREVLNGGGYVQPQQSTSIPFVTPISVSSSNSSYDNSTSYGSWVTPSIHAFQTGKPNISVYQTPIYGME